MVSLWCCFGGVRAGAWPLPPACLDGPGAAFVPRGKVSSAWRVGALLVERWWWQPPACAPPLGRRENEVRRLLALVVAGCRFAGAAWCRACCLLMAGLVRWLSVYTGDRWCGGGACPGTLGMHLVVDDRCATALWCLAPRGLRCGRSRVGPGHCRYGSRLLAHALPEPAGPLFQCARGFSSLGASWCAAGMRRWPGVLG